MKKLSLATWILISLVLGIVVGLLFMGNPEIALEYIKPFGTLFLNLIKMIVVPIVLFSIITGVVSLSDIKKVGSIGGKTVLFYMVTTSIAVTIGLVLANVFKFSFGSFDVTGLVYEAKQAPSFIETIVNIFPSNAFEPLMKASMLQVIVIALFFGFGIILSGEKGKAAADVCESFSEVSIKIMGFIIKLSPIGVFALIVPVVATNGPSVLGSLLSVVLVTFLAYMIHTIVVYSLAVKSFAKISPAKFFKGMLPAITLAFSSASSVGTLPLNLECTQKLGATRDVASFVLPLGATINMDGTAIYQGVCAIFIATVFGINLTIGQQISIILTATLASVGTAGVPGAGMLMLAMVLESVGLPLEGIMLIAGVDRILDMGRTTVNITGDAACTLIISNIENK